ncbi:MAG: hypothetical protein IJ461_10815 [Clostridia bacterium]|nr:hypothetical protein [Clostridia bacterium]
MKKRMIVLLATLLLISGSALGEYRWAGEFPAAPQQLTPGYTVSVNPQVKAMAEQALGILGFPQSGIEWEGEELFAQDRPEDTGERATLRYNKRGDLHYAKDSQARQTTDPNEALAQSVAFAEKLLGSRKYMPQMPRIGWYYEQSGQLMTSIYDFIWPLKTPEGVPLSDKSLTVTYANGLVSALHLWDGILTPVEGEQSNAPYQDASAALARLNEIASRQESTTLDDPNDLLESIYLTYTPVFSQEGTYTPAWAFQLRDANSYQQKATAFVELATGKVYDGRRILE